jgi:hypothetical protein
MSEADINKKKGEPQREGILVGVHQEDRSGREIHSALFRSRTPELPG